MKKIFRTLPELFFTVMGLFWIAESFFTLGSVNYFALLGTWLLFVQFFYKNRAAGLVYGFALGSFSLYRLLEVFSGPHARQESLIAGGTASSDAVLFGIAVIMAVGMVLKYVTAKINYGENVLTTTY